MWGVIYKHNLCQINVLIILLKSQNVSLDPMHITLEGGVLNMNVDNAPMEVTAPVTLHIAAISVPVGKLPPEKEAQADQIVIKQVLKYLNHIQLDQSWLKPYFSNKNNVVS